MGGRPPPLPPRLLRLWSIVHKQSNLFCVEYDRPALRFAGVLLRYYRTEMQKGILILRSSPRQKGSGGSYSPAVPEPLISTKTTALLLFRPSCKQIFVQQFFFLSRFLIRFFTRTILLAQKGHFCSNFKKKFRSKATSSWQDNQKH